MNETKKWVKGFSVRENYIHLFFPSFIPLLTYLINMYRILSGSTHKSRHGYQQHIVNQRYEITKSIHFALRICVSLEAFTTVTGV